MRRVYETSRDLENERIIALALASKWGYAAKKLPKFYGVDWAFEKAHKIVGWVEIKCRSTPSTEYESYMISLQKYMGIKSLVGGSGVKGLIVVRFSDGIKYADVTSVAIDRIAMGGRRDRGDPDDLEPVIHIPIDSMVDVTL